MILFSKKSSPKEETEEMEPSKNNWLSRLSNSLAKTRAKLTNQISSLFLGKKTIDDDLFESLENLLLSADVGIKTTDHLIKTLTEQVARDELKNPEILFSQLKIEMEKLLKPCEKTFAPNLAKPYVILLIGINGAGKTTSIGKLAHYFQKNGKSVLLAAGDTFRAAAVEQLQTWGARNKIEVIAQKTGSDSASVIFDAIQAAKARNTDILLADTAGRLHNKNHLMEELKKIKRVMQKADVNMPHEVFLVLDATIGQNTINQVTEFHSALGVTGLILTKLDGSAKGGVIFSIAEEFKLPIAFIGVGEGIEDLQIFKAENFVDALFE